MKFYISLVWGPFTYLRIEREKLTSKRKEGLRGMHGSGGSPRIRGQGEEQVLNEKPKELTLLCKMKENRQV